MYIDDAIEIKKPETDSHFRLAPCRQCKSDNVAYVKYENKSRELWRVSCFDCGYTVKPDNAVCAHDAQQGWNSQNAADTVRLSPVLQAV